MKKRPKLKGFYALYVHYLYVLGKLKRQEFPPKMTAKFKAEVMKFEQYKEEFRFLLHYKLSIEQEVCGRNDELEGNLQNLKCSSFQLINFGLQPRFLGKLCGGDVSQIGDLESTPKQRTIANVAKKKRPVFHALAMIEALSPVKDLFESCLGGRV